MKAIALALLVATSAHAQMFRCEGPDGRTTYSNTPCANATEIEGTRRAGEMEKREVARERAEHQARAAAPAFMCSAPGYLEYRLRPCKSKIHKSAPCSIAGAPGALCSADIPVAVRQDVVSRAQACEGARATKHQRNAAELCNY